MDHFLQQLQRGDAHVWLFFPTAILLGALHGLEPGHSKTMMAAFIIAVRGTVFQAVLLGLAAAFSHTLIIWFLAAAALKYGGRWSAETTEPYFQLASALFIAGLALWMLWRTRRDVRAAAAHAHSHQHHYHDAPQRVPIGAGFVEVSIFETGVPPVFRLHFFENDRLIEPPAAETVTIETIRPDGVREIFRFHREEGRLQSTTEIQEPHEFEASVVVESLPRVPERTLSFREEDHAHDHEHLELQPGDSFEDAHERAHARDIHERFLNRQVTTGQIVLFGLSGGLMPCPAAFSILLVCLQLKQMSLGFGIVAAFSLGLALTLVAVGAAAAWSAQRAEKKFKGFGELARRAPYLSSAFLLLIAMYIGWHAVTALSGR